MDVDGSSLAAAALYDMKNEQLQQAIPSNDTKQPDAAVSTTTDQSVTTTTTAEGQQFAEGGKRKFTIEKISFSNRMILFSKKWAQKFHSNSVNFSYTKDIFLIYFIFLFGKFIQNISYSNMILS